MPCWRHRRSLGSCGEEALHQHGRTSIFPQTNFVELKPSQLATVIDVINAGAAYVLKRSHASRWFRSSASVGIMHLTELCRSREGDCAVVADRDHSPGLPDSREDMAKCRTDVRWRDAVRFVCYRVSNSGSPPKADSVISSPGRSGTEPSVGRSHPNRARSRHSRAADSSAL